MRRTTAVAALAVSAAAAGCIAQPPDGEPPPASAPAFRWLPGLSATAVAEPGRRAERRELADDAADPGERCQRGAGSVLTLSAEVAAPPGDETIRASIAGGVEVTGADGAPLGRLTAFACGGSLDDIDALAAGDVGIGAPVIAVVATIGGAAEATTWLALLEVGDRRLHRVFTGPIAHRDGDVVTRGELAAEAGALIYRAPRAARAARWTFDPAERVFVTAR
jgi:hypothetical protein